MSERITDDMVEAFCRATGPGPIDAATIRAGLVAALTRRELERVRRGMPGWTVGMPDEIADEIARYVLELEDGPARGLLHDVIDRLNGEYARRNRVVHGPEDPEPIDWSWTGERERED